VLAGDLGKEGLIETERYGPTAPRLGRVPPLEAPALVGRDTGEILSGVKPVAGAPLDFQTSGIGRPRDVRLLPFYKVFDSRYTVCWRTYTPAEWEKRKAELAVVEARRKEIELHTVDSVNLGAAESERDHNLRGEGMSENPFGGRRAREARNGWFSYELRVRPDQPVILVATYRGSEGRRRVFDVLVEGERVATQSLEYHPTEIFDVEYPLPESLTRGKERITVKFQAHPEATAGSVVDVRTVAGGAQK
jgi:hypothetical protein